MPPTFAAAPINGQIFRFERENELDKQFVDDVQAEGQSTDLCKFFFSGTGCNKGARCQFRHARNDRLIVCKHWLRGLCKKGEYCEYLHEFDMSKMPECYFFSKFGECSNAECMYRHVDPDKKRNECPYYARGFCKHGPKCRLRHVKKEACHDYLAGFCKNGPDCVFGHARFEISRVEDDEDGPGGIDRFGFGRPKGPMPMPKVSSTGEDGSGDAPPSGYTGRAESAIAPPTDFHGVTPRIQTSSSDMHATYPPPPSLEMGPTGSVGATGGPPFAVTRDGMPGGPNSVVGGMRLPQGMMGHVPGAPPMPGNPQFHAPPMPSSMMGLLGMPGFGPNGNHAVMTNDGTAERGAGSNGFHAPPRTSLGAFPPSGPNGTRPDAPPTIAHPRFNPR